MRQGYRVAKTVKGYRETDRGGRKAREHHLVWEAAHGPVPKGLFIHHRNGIRDDNRLENLQLMAPSDHAVHHRKSDRATIAEKVKAWWANPENRAKRVAQLRMSWQRPEQRANMSAAALKRCATPRGRAQLEAFAAAGREARGQS